MGDEYTPTDDTLRSAWVSEAWDPDGDPFGGRAVHGFDRWLAEHDAQVLESARNRLNGHDPAGEQLQRMADEKRNAGREDER